MAWALNFYGINAEAFKLLGIAPEFISWVSSIFRYTHISHEVGDFPKFLFQLYPCDLLVISSIFPLKHGDFRLDSQLPRRWTACADGFTEAFVAGHGCVTSGLIFEAHALEEPRWDHGEYSNITCKQGYNSTIKHRLWLYNISIVSKIEHTTIQSSTT